MAKKTYEEYLLEENPGLAAVAQDYAALGVATPLLLAQAEASGEDPYPASLLGYALRMEVNPPDDHRWIDAARSGDMNLENETLLAQAADAVAYLEQSGVDLTRLTPLVRAVQAQVVRQVAALLDEGPEISCLPMPEGREFGWGVFSVNADDSIGRQMGVRSAVSDPEEL